MYCQNQLKLVAFSNNFVDYTWQDILIFLDVLVKTCIKSSLSKLLLYDLWVENGAPRALVALIKCITCVVRVAALIEKQAYSQTVMTIVLYYLFKI